MPKHWVGRSVPRREGHLKVTGAAKYIDDIVMPGMIHGTTVRSTIARGKIRGIRFAPHIPWDEFTIVTHKDVPGNLIVSLIEKDQPFLAADEIRHPEEPVVLLAHPDKYLLEEARKAVTIEADPLPAVLTIDDSISRKEVIWGADNVFKRYLIEKGDVEAAFRQPGLVIVEGEYETGAQEQLYIENNGVIAVANPEDGVTVWGSLQCPYYVHKGLLPLFNLPEEKVRIIQAETGGGFGGKEEYPTLLAGHAALLAWKSRKPVKMIYDRAEDMAATTKRHPSRTRHRTAVTRDGRIVAIDIDFTLDGGAYATLSSVVLSRGTIHAPGPYRCDHVRVASRAVATNTPPHGAFRGFGAPQSIFAMERHLDRVAKAVGLDPVEIRKRNFLRPGDTTATGQVVKDPIDLPALLDRVLKEADYDAKRARFARENAAAVASGAGAGAGAGPAVPRRGIGFAAFMHGAGFTGSGERFLASVVGAEATAEGKVRVLAASTEIGQGTNTVFSQIAADALGLALEDIEVAQPDTARVPNSGPTVASRTVMVVGKLVESACLGLRQTLVQSGLLPARSGAATGPREAEEFKRACGEYVRKYGALKSYSQYKQPPGVNWDDKLYRGEAYATYAWAAYVAEVAVDPATYEVKVEEMTTIQEIGKVVNPVMAAGQIEGGVTQAIGFAVYEDVVWRDGRMANNRMTNYIIPTASDTPPIKVLFEELPTEHGPQGAKGIGELPMDGVAPAVLNAVEEATGVPVSAIPLVPERMMEAAIAAGALS